MRREYYRDPYNDSKVWEVNYISGGYYLRQIISGRQFGRGQRVSKAFIEDIGIFDFQLIGTTI